VSMKIIILVRVVTAMFVAFLLIPPVTHGQVFVANFGGNSITEFDSSGNTTTFASGGLLNGPSALAFDGSGNLYVANYYNNNIVKYTPAGVGSIYASAGLNNPTGLAFDGSGNLFAVNSADTNLVAQAGGTIVKFDSVALGLLYASGLNHPYSVAFDNSGNLYVSENTGNAIDKYSPNGQGSVFASSGNLLNNPNLNGPWGLAFSGGNLYVANYTDNSIGEFNSSGFGTIFAASGLDRPSGLAFDGLGNLFVANYGNNTIEMFNSSGVGSVFATGGLNEPIAIAIAESPVPEPANWSLLVMGAAVLYGACYRKS
jgi:DNA-binding beta-propeller fold protein YncE